MRKEALNNFAEKLASVGFTFKVSQYGNTEAVTTAGETLPELYKTGIFLTFCITPHEGDNDYKRELVFLETLRRYRSVALLTAYNIHYGNAYIIVSTEDAKALEADRAKKDEAREEFWRIRHEALKRKQATA